MRALRFSRYGPPSVLAVAELPLPKPGKGEALVEINASGINPGDVKNVAGLFGASLPRVPGRDFAGVVVGGEAESGLEVWGSGVGFGGSRDGSHAEYVVVPFEWLSRKPANLSMEHAAAVGVPYVTAWSALVTAGKIDYGETVLIVGVSGAVGSAATQIAHWKKAKVIGASTKSENPSGADALINTTNQDLVREVRALTNGKGVDIVLDAVGGAMFEPSLQTLRRGGRQIAIAGTDEKVSFNLAAFFENQSQLIGVDTGKLSGVETAEIMDLLRDGFEEGHLKPPSVTAWPLDRGVEAYAAVAARKEHKKQVIVPGL